MTETNNQTSNPWSLEPEDTVLTSHDGGYKITYENLAEWRMNAPLGGKGILVDTTSSKRFNIFDLAGCPPVWSTSQQLVAIPLWIVIDNHDEDDSQTVFQRIGVVDAQALTLKIYTKKFRVLHLKSFEGTKISGVDSPMFESQTFDFDISTEEVESEHALN